MKGSTITTGGEKNGSTKDKEGRGKRGEGGGVVSARVKGRNVNCTLQGATTGCTVLMGNITLVTRTLSLTEPYSHL